MKLWAGRFQKETDDACQRLQRLHLTLTSGCTGRTSPAPWPTPQMLGDCGIISQEDAAAIVDGLQGILADIEAGKVEFTADNEDIHMNVEALLTARIGDAGKRLHTARSPATTRWPWTSGCTSGSRSRVIAGQLLELERVLCRQAAEVPDRRDAGLYPPRSGPSPSPLPST